MAKVIAIGISWFFAALLLFFGMVIMLSDGQPTTFARTHGRVAPGL